MHEIEKVNNQNSLIEEAKSVGFRIMPPNIDEFIKIIGMENSIYDFWKEHLRNIYPNSLHVQYNHILLTGAIGTGKSTMSKIMALYTTAKILCLKDFEYFKLALTKPIGFLFFHVNMAKANKEFVEYLRDVYETNEYFKYLRKARKKLKLPEINITFASDGVKSNNAIGSDVIFFVFSEANFVNPEMIYNKIDQAHKRFKSRFLQAMKYVGNIIIDTSSSLEGTSISESLKENDDFYVVRASQWEVKPWQYWKKGEFYVYTGGIYGAPCIVKKENIDKYEKEKIIKVPMELYKEFESNIYEALMSLAGINVRSPNALFDKEQIKEIAILPKITPDLVNPHYLEIIADDVIRGLPSNLVYYVHVDTSIKGDNTGIAIACWDDENIKIPVAFAVNAEGEDIPMYTIENFIIKLSSTIRIAAVTADTYQSAKLLQDIERKTRIKTKTLSVDKTATQYFALKRAIVDKILKIVDNKILIEELCNLVIIQTAANTKVDHPASGSKDIADAVAGASFMCMTEGKIYAHLKSSNNENDLAKVLAQYKAKIQTQYNTNNYNYSYNPLIFQKYINPEQQ